MSVRQRVCVILPFKNEENHLRFCLSGLLDFRLPEGFEMVILAMDGGSEDGSVRIVEEASRRHPNILRMTNPRGYQGCAVNLGVRSVPAEFYLWLGAHTFFPPDYLEKCLETSTRTGAEVVGGGCETLPGADSYGARIVQAMTTHRFGVGNSGFRVGAPEGPVDTVPYALFSQTAFARGGYLDERLVRAQDYEFNRRLAKMGMKIWMNPVIRCRYKNQASFRKFMKKQILLEAPYNSYMWYLAPYAFTPRHAITGLFALGIIGGLVLSHFSPVICLGFQSVMLLYAGLALTSAAQQAWRYRCWVHLLFLPFCFFLFHFGHGIGILAGLVRLMTGTAPVQGGKEPWDGAGFFRCSAARAKNPAKDPP
jgi:glycosyltransferase involved in cell wall biosynthesis